MENAEMFQAIQQMLIEIKSEMASMNQRIERVELKTDGVRVLLDEEIRRDINLLAEGHELILERLPDLDNVAEVESRLTAVEVVVRKNSKDIQQLEKAQ